jgi:hypothetical protein
MHFYRHGVEIHPWVARSGNTFVARVFILQDDGETTLLGNLNILQTGKRASCWA